MFGSNLYSPPLYVASSIHITKKVFRYTLILFFSLAPKLRLTSLFLILFTWSRCRYSLDTYILDLWLPMLVFIMKLNAWYVFEDKQICIHIISKRFDFFMISRHKVFKRCMLKWCRYLSFPRVVHGIICIYILYITECYYSEGHHCRTITLWIVRTLHFFFSYCWHSYNIGLRWKKSKQSANNEKLGAFFVSQISVIRVFFLILIIFLVWL